LAQMIRGCADLL